MTIRGYPNPDGKVPVFTASRIESPDVGTVLAAAIAVNPELKSWKVAVENVDESDDGIEGRVS